MVDEQRQAVSTKKNCETIMLLWMSMRKATNMALPPFPWTKEDLDAPCTGMSEPLSFRESHCYLFGQRLKRREEGLWEWHLMPLELEGKWTDEEFRLRSGGVMYDDFNPRLVIVEFFMPPEARAALKTPLPYECDITPPLKQTDFPLSFKRFVVRGGKAVVQWLPFGNTFSEIEVARAINPLLSVERSYPFNRASIPRYARHPTLPPLVRIDERK